MFKIECLELFDSNDNSYKYEFAAGINYFIGSNNTGKTEFYKFINGDRKIEKLYNHKNRFNNERDIEIFRRLPQGANSLHESIADIMPYTRRNNIFKDKYFKLDETQICKTITSHMKYDCNMSMGSTRIKSKRSG